MAVILFCSSCILVRLFRPTDERPDFNESDFAELVIWAEKRVDTIPLGGCSYKSLFSPLSDVLDREQVMICADRLGKISHLFVDARDNTYVFIPDMGLADSYVDGYAVSCYEVMSEDWYRCRASR
jgi:hypothetical protein